MGQTRVETDSMGQMDVPTGALYGAQTARAVANFPVSGQPMPPAFIAALGLVKRAAAEAHKRAGRLDGAEMSRREWLSEGKIPLQTLRSNVDFAQVNAHTTYGVIGIKVWVYKGEVFEQSKS